MRWSDEDLAQIEAHGFSENEINKQLELLSTGSHSLEVVRFATINDGIIQLEDADVERYQKLYDLNIAEYKVTKFVPASGAATRMFNHLLTANKSAESDAMVREFRESFSKLPFIELLADCFVAHGASLSLALSKNEWQKIIDLMLDPSGLGYGVAPKGLVPFHRYDDHVRTPFEEHLVESATYVSKNGTSHIHFTVPAEFLSEIESFISQRKSSFEKYSETTFEIDYSVQSPETDTVALDANNDPARDVDGNLIFRPGGHGALVKNLNALKADIVFIKNIDNVVPESRLSLVTKYKKVLGGYLINLVSERDRILGKIDAGDELDIIIEEIEQAFYVQFPKEIDFSRDELRRFLIKPIRVCGVVRNTGEPGGGPYWVKDSDGTSRLQIVERNQINMHDSKQKALFESSTHFNPVDIVCYLKDSSSQKLDLQHFVDPKTAFVASKVVNGQKLKVLEHPGLWNGSMAGWLTVFIEVPTETFAPVKSVNDLFRDSHQA